MPGGFKLQIIAPDRRVVLSWPAGHPIESDLADAVVKAARVKGLGYFRSQAYVEAAIRDAVAAAIHQLKLQVRPTP